MKLESLQPRVVIIDTGTANIGSVVNMSRRLGVEPIASADRGELESADRLLLPMCLAALLSGREHGSDPS